MWVGVGGLGLRSGWGSRVPGWVGDSQFGVGASHVRVEALGSGGESWTGWGDFHTNEMRSR